MRSITHRLEGADGKGLHREHLAGGPPYPISRVEGNSSEGHDADAIASHGVDSDGTPCVMAVPSKGIQGNEWGAYVVLARFAVTEHGMVSRTSPRSPSGNSTRGSHAPPGRTGEPCTGGSGTGGRRARSCEVREMRIAVAARTLVRGYSEKATGELIDTETVTVSSEEGRWKRAERHLAGGGSYLTYGSNGGIGETCRKVTRPDPTHSIMTLPVSHTTVPMTLERYSSHTVTSRSGRSEPG